MSIRQSLLIRMSLVSCVLVGLLASGGITPTVVQAAPAITSPSPGSPLLGDTQVFHWIDGGTANINQWWLYVGTSGVGSNNLFNSSTGTAMFQTVSGLPTDGSTVYVRLYWKVSGTSWASTDYTYTAFTSGSGGGGGGDHHTLRWDQILDASNGSTVAGQEGCNSDRFKCVLGMAAILDMNTGLVWERFPLNTTQTWASALRQCIQRGTGGQMGWRLPSIHELTSLVVPGNPAGSPDLPAGHPFGNVASSIYWSATSDVEVPTNAWVVGFVSGTVVTLVKTFNHFGWCVRGGGPLSEY